MVPSRSIVVTATFPVGGLWPIHSADLISVLYSYNSAIYTMQPMNAQQVLVTTPDFLTGGSFSVNASSTRAIERGNHTLESRPQYNPEKLEESRINSRWGGLGGGRYSFDLGGVCNDQCVAKWRERLTIGDFKANLTKFDCMKAYLGSYSTNSSDVIFISSQDLLSGGASDPSRNNSLLFAIKDVGYIQLPNQYWICGASNTFDCRKFRSWKDSTDIENWNIIGYKIDYCLVSQRDLEQKCGVNYSLPIMNG